MWPWPLGFRGSSRRIRSSRITNSIFLSSKPFNSTSSTVWLDKFHARNGLQLRQRGQTRRGRQAGRKGHRRRRRGRTAQGGVHAGRGKGQHLLQAVQTVRQNRRQLLGQWQRNAAHQKSGREGAGPGAGRHQHRHEAVPVQGMGKNNVMMVCVPTPKTKPPPTSELLRVKTRKEADELYA
uniref:(northern house mosquito) hypothetical protein n=1 Tax=Culex pipiens TaxID=7175 RepID=A0A8D8B5G4_CULPI